MNIDVAKAEKDRIVQKNGLGYRSALKHLRGPLSRRPLGRKNTTYATDVSQGSGIVVAGLDDLVLLWMGQRRRGLDAS